MAKKKPVNSYPLNYVSNQLNNILSEMIIEYGEELTSKAAAVTREIAKDFAEELKTVTPRSTYDSEHLADTVMLTETTRRSYGRTNKVYHVHYGKWQIAHLLEFGWTLKNGQRLERTPFIRPLFDKNKERYYNMYKEKLSK